MTQLNDNDSTIVYQAVSIIDEALEDKVNYCLLIEKRKQIK